MVTSFRKAIESLLQLNKILFLSAKVVEPALCFLSLYCFVLRHSFAFAFLHFLDKHLRFCVSRFVLFFKRFDVKRVVSGHIAAIRQKLILHCFTAAGKREPS